jgi:hypothetical protein
VSKELSELVQKMSQRELMFGMEKYFNEKWQQFTRGNDAEKFTIVVDKFDFGAAEDESYGRAHVRVRVTDRSRDRKISLDIMFIALPTLSAYLVGLRTFLGDTVVEMSHAGDISLEHEKRCHVICDVSAFCFSAIQAAVITEWEIDEKSFHRE